MRVIHIITRLIVGGAQENTVASVLGLRQKPGMDVSLISGPTSGPEGTLEPMFERHPGLLRVVPELVRPIHPWQDLRALSKLTRLLRDAAPDIVHTHSGKAGILGRLAAARAGVPVIVHTIHGPSFGTFYGVLSNTVFRAAERYAATVTTHFVVVADAMRDQYLNAGIGHAGQYTKILSGFDLEPFLQAKNDPALRNHLGIQTSDIVVGNIARLTVHKGHADLFAIAPELFRTCPQVRFLLVGDGNLRPSFEARAKELGVFERCVFTGLLPPSAIPRHVGIMDALVHLSRREGLPRALPQAMAAAKPIIAYDCDGAREVCIENETGYLLAPGEHQLLLQRLKELATSPETRARLGRTGRQYVASRFGTGEMIESLHNLYLRIVPRKVNGS